MKFLRPLLFTLAATFSFTAQAETNLPTVAHVDLNRYIGHWYEIAALPQPFERDCFASQADYSLRNDGKIDVVNSCHKGRLSGELNTAVGVGRVVDPETNAKLAVSFFPPFEGDYWILALADDYSYAMVGAPDRGSLWILSRAPTLDDATFQQLLNQAEAQGFDISAVEPMPQVESI